jgi:pimeloyl-ACP methyl ester carboxylesterase
MITSGTFGYGQAVIERAGDPARVIVFLHGIGGAAESFAELFRIWPKGPTLLAPDAAGYGGSAPYPGSWPSAEDYAHYVASLLADRCDRPADIVGHSFGCLVADAVARHFPTDVRRLVLMSPALGYASRPDTPLPETVARRVMDLEALGPERFAELRAARLVHDAVRTPEALAHVRRVMAKVNLKGYTHAARILATGDLLKGALPLVAPALVLTGAEDQITPPEGARKLHAVLSARANAESSYIEIPGAGHAIYLEQPDAVIAAITAFLGEGT